MEEMVKEQAAAVEKANHAPPWLQPHADTWCVSCLGPQLPSSATELPVAACSSR